MNRKERLTAVLRGEPVDRPPVCFYDMNACIPDPDDPDPFNIMADPSWQPLLELTRERSDRIVLHGPPFRNGPPDPLAGLRKIEVWVDGNGSRHTRQTIKAGSRTLTSHVRQDPDVMTGWSLEHLLKDARDFEAWLELPRALEPGTPDPEPLARIQARLGDSGIVGLDMGDPLCHIAPMFHMETYTLVAMLENRLMHRALERVLETLLPRVEAAARAFPGRLWRICGPEYASVPYLPPSLFREYVTRYDTPIVEAIQRHGGIARIHSHGRLKDILDDIVATGCTGLDPIEPPPTQGDVELCYVREKYGDQLILFGNLEMSDIENMPTERFRQKVEQALREGTEGSGRGFVLMPSASPYGRKVSDLTVRNYEAMVDMAEAW